MLGVVGRQFFGHYYQGRFFLRYFERIFDLKREHGGLANDGRRGPGIIATRAYLPIKSAAGGRLSG